ncbi:MAG: hypothetical protein ABIT83_01240 [Massilia sp.]
MLNRRSIVRILLSLLLLVSQQMAFTHALSHVSGNASARAGAAAHLQRDGSLSKALADQGCDQCLAFAQLVGPLGNTPRWFAVDAVGSEAIAAHASTPAPACTVCVFQSRAPPLA